MAQEERENMKKKSIAIMMAGYLALSLTACGNPLKKLPDVSETNIYDAAADMTNNEAADAIVKEIEDVILDGGAQLTGLVVYDREESEDEKERSEVSVKIAYETGNASFTDYYVCSMRYSDDDGWRVKEIARDEDKIAVCMPAQEAGEETIREYLMDYVWYCSDDEDNYTVYFNEDIEMDLTIDSKEVYTGEDIPEEIREYMGTYGALEEVWISFRTDDGFRVAEGGVGMRLWFDADEGIWDFYDSTYDGDLTVSISDDVLAALSDERMLADVSEYEVSLGYYTNPVYFTEDTYEAVSFGDYQFSGNYCERSVSLTPKGNIYDAKVIFNLTYYYYADDGWKLDWVSIDAGVESFLLEGKTLTGVMYSDCNEGAKEYAELSYTFLETTEDGKIAGEAKIGRNGYDVSAEDPIPFEASIGSDYIMIEFDDYMVYGDGWWDEFLFDTLYCNYATGQLYSAKYDYYYTLGEE